MTAHNLGVLWHAQGPPLDAGEAAVGAWVASVWSPDDQAALDALGPTDFWSWVERGHAGD